MERHCTTQTDMLRRSSTSRSASSWVPAITSRTCESYFITYENLESLMEVDMCPFANACAVDSISDFAWKYPGKSIKPSNSSNRPSLSSPMMPRPRQRLAPCFRLAQINRRGLRLLPKVVDARKTLCQKLCSRGSAYLRLTQSARRHTYDLALHMNSKIARRTR